MQDSLKEAKKYVSRTWKDLTFKMPKDRGIHIGLPNPFVAPSPVATAFAHDQFYWDSYFIILGLLVDGKFELAKGMVENFAFLQKKYGIIPSRNRLYNLGISQAPFFSSMVREIYEAKKDKKWLKKMIPHIESEFHEYWLNDHRAELHLVHEGLSRYCDHHINHDAAEHESGWDMTSRFAGKCLNFLPVDLNSMLYKYETDLAHFFEILGNEKAVDFYRNLAKRRKKTMNKLMWHEAEGYFYDYNYKTGHRRHFYSTASYFPMWAGFATKAQAKALVHNLKNLETKWGLASTKKVRTNEYLQWDYPNAWPNQQWIVIQGLLNYGYEKEAKRIASKWIKLNVRVFEKTGKFWEKYNVVTGDVGKDGRYPTQHGFGWTNGVFLKILATFRDGLL